MTSSQLSILRDAGILIFGDLSFRGDCPLEGAEHTTFFNQLRIIWPLYGRIAIHPKNEGKRKGKDFESLKRDKANGLTPGASDIQIPGGPSFVCEMKRLNHMKSDFEKDQIPYLLDCKENGAFVCVALGYKAALEAVEYWHKNRV